MVDTHRLYVRGDRSIDERKAGATRVFLPELLEASFSLPEIKHAMVYLGQVELRGDGPESRSFACLRHARSFQKQKRRPDFSGRRMPWYHPS
jgi:hypothetical protein